MHAVTDDRVLALPDVLERAAALAAGPGVAIQLRGRLPAARMLDLADRLREITSRTGTRLIIHDRLDLAMLCAADGVHLPGEGLPTPVVRQAIGGDGLIGRSAHAPAEARSAAAGGADYVFLGNIWETASHPGRRGLGPGTLAEAAPARVVAIGGVTAERAAEAARAGAVGVAAIRALWDAGDPAAAVHTMRVPFECDDLSDSDYGER